MKPQAGILPLIPSNSRFLELDAVPGPDTDTISGVLRDIAPGDRFVLGLGSAFAERLAGRIFGLTSFPDFGNQHVPIPSTQTDAWVWVRGENTEQVADIASEVTNQLSSIFTISGTGIDGFKYQGGRDLTGYEDGTENPVGQEAVRAAICETEGLTGSSFVAVQKWVHDMTQFHRLSSAQQDDAFGRRRETNEEFDAPDSAHVKRTAQEDFDPEAFILRRSSPWRDESEAGLMFIAFGATFDAFEAQMRRMVGLDDGILDGLFQFSRPVTGGYYWCPAVDDDGKIAVPNVI